ncbi:MAG: hypothetical protein AAF399_25320 [Bacteroidota bacterium]
MKIVNPLYDLAFKYLMQNNRIAKKVLSVLLECEILELTLSQQEMVAVSDQYGVKLYRLDFSALIVDENGQQQKVLIELQKSKLPTHALRFRSYLGQNYAKKDAPYPIISIYILGYNVVDIPYLAVSIDNQITNTVTKEAVDIQSEFIQLLTHKVRIIQVRRLSDKRQSQLEQFLLFFNQAWVTEDNFILDLQEVPEQFEDVAQHLHGAAQDEAFRRQLEGEAEIEAIFNSWEAEREEGKLRIAVAEAEKQQAEQARQRAEQEKQSAEEEKRRAEEEKRRTEQVLENEKQRAEKLAAKLRELGIDPQDIPD